MSGKNKEAPTTDSTKAADDTTKYGVMESTSNEPKRSKVATSEDHQNTETAPTTRKVTSTSEDYENMDTSGDATPTMRRPQQYEKDDSKAETPDRAEPTTVNAVGMSSLSATLSPNSSTTTPKSTTFESGIETSEVQTSIMQLLAETMSAESEKTALKMKAESQHARLR